MKRITDSFGIVLLMAAAVITGCTEDRATAEKAGYEKGSSGSTAKAQPAAKPRTQTMVIPAGTNVVASLQTRLSTDGNNSGDRFQASVVDGVVIDGRTVVPAGAQIQGVLRDVQASGKIKGRARMTLDFEQIVDSNGKTQAISAQPLTMQADSKTKGDVEKIAAGGILGGIIGGIAGGKKGAAIGAGAGAGAGTIVMLATKGDEVELAAGQKLNVYMTSPMSIVLVAQK